MRKSTTIIEFLRVSSYMLIDSAKKKKLYVDRQLHCIVLINNYFVSFHLCIFG